MDNLEQYRQEINEIDLNLLTLFANRYKVVKKVGEYKKEKGIPIQDKAREESILQNLFEKGKKYGLDKEFIEKIWTSIFQYAYEKEK